LQLAGFDTDIKYVMVCFVGMEGESQAGASTISAGRSFPEEKTPRRKVSCQKRENRPLVQSPNQVWSMDFMSDTLANGQSVRILTILDVCTRESIAIRVDHRFSANKVVKVLEEVATE
jgi:transposase InsO family protein